MYAMYLKRHVYEPKVVYESPSAIWNVAWMGLNRHGFFATLEFITLDHDWIDIAY